MKLDEVFVNTKELEEILGVTYPTALKKIRRMAGATRAGPGYTDTWLAPASAVMKVIEDELRAAQAQKRRLLKLVKDKENDTHEPDHSGESA